MHQPDLSALNGQALDPEVFRRVWSRVMPNGADSPILPLPLPPPQTEEHPCRTSSPACQDVPALTALLEQLYTDFAALTPLLRMGGPAARTLRAAATRYRRALGQLSAARFLITGLPYRPARRPAPTFSSLPLALRHLFDRAAQWEQTCLQAAEETKDAALAQLYRRLADEGAEQAAVFRTLLERLLTPP